MPDDKPEAHPIESELEPKPFVPYESPAKLEPEPEPTPYVPPPAPVASEPEPQAYNKITPPYAPPYGPSSKPKAEPAPPAPPAEPDPKIQLAATVFALRRIQEQTRQEPKVQSSVGAQVCEYVEMTLAALGLSLTFKADNPNIAQDIADAWTQNGYRYHDLRMNQADVANWSFHNNAYAEELDPAVVGKDFHYRVLPDPSQPKSTYTVSVYTKG
jgi:hypothetical protein